ncbi:MAG TPA: methylmalonyl-CoA mutase family protein, partial [Bacteroidales bacterium]|nr:methylmalonyl-CoA mutase family protein [Bacteroidales bacterium]
MTEKLFTEFPPVSTQEWETQIIRDLKGADYEKKLVWKTLEGFSVRPYYRTEDLKDLPYLNTLPGEFPYLRGTKTVNDWLIHQTFHATGRYAQANREAHSALDRGLESVGFRFKENYAVSFDDIKVLLNGIYLPAVEISFEHCGTSRTDILDAFIKYVQDNKIDPGQVRARFDFDPLGRSMDGDMSLEDSLSRLAECIEKVKDFPLLRIISVSG